MSGDTSKNRGTGAGSRGNERRRAQAYTVRMCPPVNRGRYGETSNDIRSFELIIRTVDSSVDATLLHLTRLRLTQDFPGQITACLDVLNDEELWWRPHEQVNAVGNLVVHLSWSNRYYLEQVIAGRDIGRNRDAEFAARGGLSKGEVRQLFDDSVQVITGVLDGLQPAQMAQETGATGKPTTYARILMHVTHHNATHMGQIVWITKMLHPGALDEVWFKMRGK